jgi:hypothetical protein
MICAMTALRLISLPMHGALEMFVGLTTMAAPFVLGFSPAGAFVGVVVGALLVGLALAASAPAGAGRQPLPVASHYAFDYGLATGLIGAAAVVGLAGDRAAAVFFAAAALAQVALNLTTRYSARA